MRILVFTLLAAGCGSSTTTVGSADDFDFQSVQIGCDARFRCCSPAVAMLSGSDPANCASKVLATASHEDRDAALAAGTVKFDPASAAACLDWMRSNYSSCDSAPSGGAAPDACRNIIIGALPVGAACAYASGSALCAPGLYCAGSTSASGGMCAALPAAGGDCSVSQACTGGTVCLPNSRCGAPLANGQPCVDNAHCLSDNCVCLSDDCVNSVCSAQTHVLRDLLCQPPT